ncbi:MAG: octanoyltransferase, partial [Actinobacteria bacterium]|nr:octanoyltransferase [Actinomycetota bacterium]
MERWRLIVSAAAPGARQLALDQAMAEAVQDGRQPPTLRFYTWWPRALSLGFSQRFALVDAALAGVRGVGVVRRPTGGQAILHHDELTYAIALPRQHALAAGGGSASYQRLSHGLVAGLLTLGLAPDPAHPLAPGDRRVRAPAALTSVGDPRAHTSLAVCFATPSAHELVVHGHKVVGSAQSR